MALFGRLIIFNLVLLSVLMCSCKSPCDGGPHSCCEGNLIGELHFTPSDTDWTPLNSTSVNFKNDKGFMTSFYVKYKTYGVSTHDVVYKTKECLCGTDYCYDYVNTDTYNLYYHSTNLPFSISYNKSMVITGHNAKYDSLTGNSVLDLNVNTVLFNLPMNRPFIKNFVLLDSIQFNGKNYNNVIHVYQDSNTVNHTIIVPIGIYYTKGCGIIGFYLTNGEFWTVQ